MMTRAEYREGVRRLRRLASEAAAYRSTGDHAASAIAAEEGDALRRSLDEYRTIQMQGMNAPRSVRG